MSGATLARRHAGAWSVLARALAAEQLTGDARAAVQRLNHQVEAFAARHAADSLPAVLIEATPELIAEFGCVALHLGDDKFAFIGAHGDESRPAVDGNHGGDGHAHSLLFDAIEDPDLARALTAANAGTSAELALISVEAEPPSKASVLDWADAAATGLFTPRALRLLALLWLLALAAIVLVGCGGGGDDPDVMTPRVNCATEVCR